MAKKKRVTRGKQYLDAAESRLPGSGDPALVYATMAQAAETGRLADQLELLPDLIAETSRLADQFGALVDLAGEFRIDVNEIIHKDPSGRYYLRIHAIPSSWLDSD